MAKSGITLKPIIGSGIAVSNLDGSKGGGQGILVPLVMQPAGQTVSFGTASSFAIGSGNTYGKDRACFVGTLGSTSNVLVCTDETSLYTIDTTNLSSPVTLGSIALVEASDALTVDGNYAFVISEGGNVYTYDISDPSSISLVATYTNPNSAELDVWHWVTKYGNYLVVNAHYPGGVGSGSILFFDISNPLSITLAQRIRNDTGSWGGGDTYVKGDTLYATDYFYRESVDVEQDTAVMRCLDVTTLVSPAVLDDEVIIPNPLSLENLNGWRLLGQDNTLYMLDARNLQAWDITGDGTVQSYIGYVQIASDVEGAILTNNLIFAVSSFDSKLEAFAITDGQVPTKIGEYTIPGDGAGSNLHTVDETRKVLFYCVNGILHAQQYTV